MLGDLTANYNGIPRSYYRFGASWPHVRETLLVIQEQDGDPFAVMMPTTEIIRFYYAPSTRLAQALFWGEYGETFNAERSGVLEEGRCKSPFSAVDGRSRCLDFGSVHVLAGNAMRN